MTQEEILAEANIRYPIGTKYIPMDSKGTKYEDSRITHKIPSIIDDSDAGFTIDAGYGYIYAAGKWATILESNTNYQIY